MEETELKKLIQGIAKKCFHVSNLETQNSDRLDFHEVSVWQIEEALRDAFNEGVKYNQTS